ncbi:hypothetical protein OsJ_18405 [Oryza sativa Japonica Group]|uniref:Uncharacterized protein n=1 Tax=Oryza sativa subsp. japonica TaxID=39947 RepID=B9FPD9_ORYSJ|nr:hypothetical protein OsJ_18405 [Oryza sativa Japonica Group]
MASRHLHAANLLMRRLPWPRTPPASFPTPRVGHLQRSLPADVAAVHLARRHIHRLFHAPRWAPRLLPGHRARERRSSFGEVEGRSWRRHARLVAATIPATASPCAASLPVVPLTFSRAWTASSLHAITGDRLPGRRRPSDRAIDLRPRAAGLLRMHCRLHTNDHRATSAWIHWLGRQIRPCGAGSVPTDVGAGR